MHAVHALVVGGVDAHDMHQVVGITSHEVTAHDFGAGADRIFKLIEQIFSLGLERDLDKDRHTPPYRIRVDEHDVTVDHTTFFEPSDAPKRGRGGEPDAVGQLGARHPPIALELLQDGDVQLI